MDACPKNSNVGEAVISLVKDHKLGVLLFSGDFGVYGPSTVIQSSVAKVLEHDGKCTVQILCIGTDRSQQTVQTKIRLLLKKQSDQGLRCLPFHQHLLDALMQCYIKLFYF